MSQPPVRKHSFSRRRRGQHSRECCAPTNLDTLSCKQSQKRGRTAISWRPMCIGVTETTAVLETDSREQARQYIEAGADIVVGAHPHCLQGFAFEHGKHVAYSLGNFWFNMDTVGTGLPFRQNSQRRVKHPVQLRSRVSSMEDVPHSWKMQRARRYYSICGRFRLECASHADGTLELEQPEL